MERLKWEKTWRNPQRDRQQGYEQDLKAGTVNWDGCVQGVSKFGVYGVFIVSREDARVGIRSQAEPHHRMPGKIINDLKMRYKFK